ncbi:LANO_0H06898g1_1 [Lachancea nothofagi CBS 11611]|uniref:Conserved oligomeric Golgi complex subunit 6 n=1 Tax=Lachancea nothofagi CBS 11611 TaxID=1266666 RepID=A0A1G4KLF5_9SACH|nr:LANO_0H06898g1_1 [Lachancea nothofagi CBS 11611]
MDFLDYQTYALDDTTTNDTQLPEPASRISFQSQPSFTEPDKTFQLPSLKSYNTTSEDNATLQERMQRYASLSLERLSLSSTSQYTNTELPTNSNGTLPRNDNLKQLLQSRETAANNADTLLSKKLSHVLDNYNRGAALPDVQLRNSFKVLEDNEECLNFKSQTLVRPDFVGSLARKSLRSDLENELLRSHLTIIEDIKPIVRRIKRLSEPIKSIQELGAGLLQKGDLKEDGSNLNMNKLHDLRQKVLQLQLQKQLLVIIRDKLTLTQVEEEVLVSAPMDVEFFAVVNKLMNIKEASSYLLSLQNPKAGQTLLNQTNLKIENANKRIYNYLVNFFYDLQSASRTFGERTFASDDRFLLTFQKSMVYLSNDLTLFNEVLKKIVKLRSQRILDEFLSQFDIDPSLKSRPIIMSAHDPLRYLGDVLAHVHSLIVDEADFMDSMFKFKSLDIQGTPKSVLQKNSEFLDGLGVNLLNETFKPSENSIRIRLEQIIRFEDNPVINLEICELLKLYQMMFIKYGIMPTSSLIQQLIVLKETSKNKILSGLIKLMETSEPEGKAGMELLPPYWLSSYMANLCDFFAKLEKSGNPDGPDKLLDSNFMDEAVSRLVNEKLVHYHQTRFPLAKKNKHEKVLLLVSEINCLDLILTRLSPFKNTVLESDDCKQVYNRINQQLDHSIKNLVALQTTLSLDKLGLGLYSNLFNMIFPVESVQDELDYDMYLPVSENPIMKKETIASNVHDKLNECLPELSSDIQDNLVFNVVSPKIAEQISQACLMEVSRFYTVFRQTLFHLYPDFVEDISTTLNFTESEFNTLVGLE